jgi:hypothetical protein
MGGRRVQAKCSKRVYLSELRTPTRYQTAYQQRYQQRYGDRLLFNHTLQDTFKHQQKFIDYSLFHSIFMISILDERTP